MHLIGISAKMGCGKTHLTGHLMSLLGSTWRRVSLGDGVKKEASARFAFPLNYCYSEAGKNTVINVSHPEAPSSRMTVRAILQWWGTDIRRKEKESYWVDKGRILIKQLIKGGNCVIVDDIRFPDELDLIEDLGGKNIRIDAYSGYEPNPSTKNHLSETALDEGINWDIRIAPEYGTLKAAAQDVFDELVDTEKQEDTNNENS